MQVLRCRTIETLGMVGLTFQIQIGQVGQPLAGFTAIFKNKSFFLLWSFRYRISIEERKAPGGGVGVTIAQAQSVYFLSITLPSAK